ncbi:MAG: DUF1178 family protein, partial [Deltaproteobacteria bacterium]|nr:DUF1178 family protein [Deltaproteobacteria bacterium]
MYALDLICSNGHKFESWFRNRASFEEQQMEDLITCPHCNDNNIKQIISPARIGKHQDDKNNSQKVDSPKVDPEKVVEFMEKNFDDVGKDFPEEALRIHLGESEKRCIRGTATPGEEIELKEEGVPI